MKRLCLWTACFLWIMAAPVYAEEEGQITALAEDVKKIQEDDWTLVEIGKSTAYVSAKYLSGEYQGSVEAYLTLEGPNRWNITLSEGEKDLLARIVMLEAGGETTLGQQAVTEVILNRMVSPLFPNTLEGVLSQKAQFTTWKSRGNTTPSQQVRDSVESVLRGESSILPMQTLYFSRRGENKRVQVRIGGHVFCNQ